MGKLLDYLIKNREHASILPLHVKIVLKPERPTSTLTPFGRKTDGILCGSFASESIISKTNYASLLGRVLQLEGTVL